MVTTAINLWIFRKSVGFDLNLFVKYTLQPTIWYSGVTQLLSSQVGNFLGLDKHPAKPWEQDKHNQRCLKHLCLLVEINIYLWRWTCKTGSLLMERTKCTGGLKVFWGNELFMLSKPRWRNMRRVVGPQAFQLNPADLVFFTKSPVVSSISFVFPSCLCDVGSEHEI